MDLYALVRTIVQEVLEHAPTDAKAPYVMVLGTRDEQMTVKILEHLDQGTELIFRGEAARAHPPCLWILPLLSCSNMAELATGKASDSLMAEVLQLLLAGVEVEILDFEYRLYSETAPGPLYSLYESYEKTLVTFGVTAFSKKQPETMRLRDSLVTAKSVRKASELGAVTLMVPVKATITPLAQETAKDLNVTILKRL